MSVIRAYMLPPSPPQSILEYFLLFAKTCDWLIKRVHCALTNQSKGIVFLVNQVRSEISCDLANTTEFPALPKRYILLN